MLIQVHNLSQREFEGHLLPSVLGCLIRPRGTLVQWLLTSKWPAIHSAILVFTDPAVCSFSFAACYLSSGGLYNLEWVSLYRLRGTLMQPLLESVKPLVHCAGVVRTVVAGRSFCRCFTAFHRSVQGLVLPCARIVVWTWQGSHASAAGAREASPPQRQRRPYRPHGRSSCRYLRARVRTPSHDRRLHRLRGTLIQVHNLSLSEREGLYPHPWASSVWTARDAHISAAGVPRATNTACCLLYTSPSPRD